ncbi:MAG: transcriptional repressor [Chloroflexi bacterium]|nr:transcriptional repressor [Chloroflexota bacterium]
MVQASATVTSDSERLLALLAERGYRMTGPRRQIVTVLVDGGSTSAQGLYETLRDSGTGIGRATVFRTLELLSHLGVVERVHLPDGCHTYVLSQPGHHHHLICSDCGAVLEFSDCRLDEALSELSRRTAFRIDGHWLEVFGLCQTCQRTRAE